jgi:hypothetical protein
LNSRVKIAQKLYQTKSDFVKRPILEFDGKEINLSSKFLPKEEYLSWHNKNRFQH